MANTHFPEAARVGIVARIKRAVNARVLKRWGSVATKRVLWDREFAAGQWDYLENTADDPVYRFLHRYCDRGSILDLGCGSGNTGCELDPSHYGRYTGVDISEQAVARARARSANADRQHQNEYCCGDITGYEPQQCYDVILFRESLFYVPRARIRGMLERYRNWLTDRGVFIVRMCDRDRYGSIVRLIERHFRISDRFCCPAGDIILVFR